MFLNITGGTKKERALVESLTVFSGYYLMTDATADKLEIDIELINNLYKTEGNLADVVYEDSNHRPKEFTIRVDKSYSLQNVRVNSTRNGTRFTVCNRTLGRIGDHKNYKI